MVHYPDHGLVDSPFVPSQFVLVEGVGKALRDIREAGFKLVVVSNQPGVAKKHFTMDTFEKIRKRMHKLLASEGVKLDAEYYCFHHPQAKAAKYRIDCDCRKPKPGLLLKAAREQGLDLSKSVMIGDGLLDIIAGKQAGCSTILVTNVNSLVTRLMIEQDIEPDFIAKNVTEAAEIIMNGWNGIPRPREGSTSGSTVMIGKRIEQGERSRLHSTNRVSSTPSFRVHPG
jgi:D,D-heptose 1,7-bisphosphate phosphatase